MDLGQRILPAARNERDFDELLQREDMQMMVLLETRIAQLPSQIKYAKKAGKKVFLHVDLIQGLKTDDAGMDFVCQRLKPDGVISTRTNVINAAKKYKITAVQRLFLIDGHALDHNLSLIKKTQPDFIEVLPGLIPHMIKEVSEQVGIPVIAGGLIRTREDVDSALEAGATAVSTSKKSLW
ncbi:glycerol-3-phosphate responsive antiterminator [Terribacillus aidingensis]|jgi:glycerol uptake operon antiterminator|uniref:glycerol-3-phosphate responsive antiterminator n=1 Tax=Terribacillus aidingensis TaxID=586416 RepID=UPI00344E835D